MASLDASQSSLTGTQSEAISQFNDMVSDSSEKADLNGAIGQNVPDCANSGASCHPVDGQRASTSRGHESSPSNVNDNNNTVTTESLVAGKRQFGTERGNDGCIREEDVTASSSNNNDTASNATASKKNAPTRRRSLGKLKLQQQQLSQHNKGITTPTTAGEPSTTTTTVRRRSSEVTTTTRRDSGGGSSGMSATPTARVAIDNVESPTRARGQSINDGTLEVFGLYSSFHIAQMQVGLSEPYRIGQASEVRLVISGMGTKIPMQCDGEPWLQGPSAITIGHSGQVEMLAKEHTDPTLSPGVSPASVTGKEGGFFFI